MNGKRTSSRLSGFFKTAVLILVGTALVALGYNALLVPNRVTAGGVTGLATLVYYLWKFPVGITVAVLNIPLLLWGAWKIDLVFILKTLVATLLLSFWLELFPIRPITEDMLLATAAGGVMVGAGLGMVLAADATTGGSDLAARILTENNQALPVQWIMFALDAMVIAASILVFSLEEALYAIVAVYASSRVAGWVMEGMHAAKAFYIITGATERVAARIIGELERGVTALKGRGLYTGVDREVLLCVVPRQQTVRLKRIIKEEDPDAFLLVADMREVVGQGFVPHVRRRRRLFQRRAR